MKKLTRLSDDVTGLDGEPLVDERGRVIKKKDLVSNSLARGQSEEPARAMAIALRIYECDGELELDDADIEMTRDAVIKDQLLSNLAKAAALKVFDEES